MSVTVIGFVKHGQGGFSPTEGRLISHFALFSRIGQESFAGEEHGQVRYQVTPTIKAGIYNHTFALMVFAHHFLIDVAEGPITHSGAMNIPYLAINQAVYLYLLVPYPVIIRHAGSLRLTNWLHCQLHDAAPFSACQLNGRRLPCFPVMQLCPAYICRNFLTIALRS